MTRLDAANPALARRFASASPERRRIAVTVACEYVVAVHHLDELVVQLVLASLRQGTTPDRAAQQEIERLAQEWDQKYFELAEAGRGDEADLAFSKARVASALAVASSGDEACLDEAVYEALAALDDPIELVRRIEAAIGE